jgi:hypothetical protein
MADQAPPGRARDVRSWDRQSHGRTVREPE